MNTYLLQNEQYLLSQKTAILKDYRDVEALDKIANPAWATGVGDGIIYHALRVISKA